MIWILKREFISVESSVTIKRLLWKKWSSQNRKIRSKKTGANNTRFFYTILNKIKGKKDEGAQIYQHFCVNCHATKPIIPLGAPRLGEINDWSERLKQDIKILFQHTEEGVNAMPPRGGCFECTDQQLALALVEMLPTEAKKSVYKKLVAHKKITK